jgi:hypothetical protein
MRHGLCALIVGFMTCLPTVAENKLEPPEVEQYWKAGPFRLRPGFGFYDVGYDSNVLYETEPTPDYTATVFGQLDGMVLFGDRGFLTFRELLAYTAYNEYTNLNFPTHRGDLRATMVVNRFGLFAELRNYLDTVRPVDLQAVRPEQRDNGLGLGFVFAPGWRTQIELARRFRRLRYDDSEDTEIAGQTIGERLDRDEQRWELGFSYRILELLSFTMDGYGAFLDFESPDAEGRTKDSTEYGLLPGVRFENGGSLRGAARVGWAVIHAEAPARGDFDGWIANLKLTYQPLGRTTLEFEGRREPVFSVASTSAYVLTQQLRFRLTQFLTDVYALELGAGRGLSTFPGSTLEVAREDLRFDYRGALRVRFSEDPYGQRVELRLHVGYSRTESPVAIQNIERTTVGLDGIVGF